MFKSLILSWFWEGFKVTPDDFLGDEYIHFGHPSIPKECSMSRYAAMHKGCVEGVPVGGAQD